MKRQKEIRVQIFHITKNMGYDSKDREKSDWIANNKIWNYVINTTTQLELQDFYIKYSYHVNYCI